jgi:two-component system chemotaxis response regulator CheY
MKKRIMIVDDSASMRQVTGATLSLAGYDIVEACDGQDALSKLTGELHLIISDINMPRMDGITFLKAVKSDARYRFTPVIMLTTDGSDEKKSIGRAAGAKGWIVKPFAPQALLDAVAKLALN